MEQKINVSISEGRSFYAHESSINYSPTQVILDFKCITPRVDPRSKESPSLHLDHDVVMMEPYHAKRLHELLGEVIKKYEKDFGKIQKSKAVQKAEKKKRKKINKISEPKNAPTYFG